jgi:hypothetical protein
MTSIEVLEHFSFLLDEMDLVQTYYKELEVYKDRYTDTEYSARKKIYEQMFADDYFEFKELKKQINIFIRARIWCKRWLTKRKNK